MIDIQIIRDDPTGFDQIMQQRGSDARSAPILAADTARRDVIARTQELQSKRNALSGLIGAAMRGDDRETVDRLRKEATALKDGLALLERDVAMWDHMVTTTLQTIPNLPAEDVPVGADEHDNALVIVHGSNDKIGLPHYELGEALGMMDFERAAQMSGSRFVVLSGALARLERALGGFMVDLHTTQHGYREVSPPLLVNQQALIGTGQLPKFVEDLYAVGEGLRSPSLNLIPTAEVPLTNLVADSIVDRDSLPRRYTALTPCFRAEAGSAGRDVRGMLRQHQFMKCELVAITTPEQAEAEHQSMLGNATKVLKLLGLPYRVVKLCTADMGFSARRTYDIEVWMPGQATYREISSISWCGDFQARRMNARYRAEDGKTRFLHTLNGSGLAVGRTLIAVLENYQRPDGSIEIPAALVPYMGGMTEISA